MMKAKLLIAALVPFLVASCYDQNPAEDSTRANVKVLSSVITRIHDSELGVTCWTANNRAISCLRDDNDTVQYPKAIPAPVDGGWPADGPARHVAGGPGA